MVKMASIICKKPENTAAALAQEAEKKAPRAHFFGLIHAENLVKDSHLDADAINDSY